MDEYIEYIEYLAKSVDVEYDKKRKEYFAEKLNDMIHYNEYLADRTSYDEYIARNLADINKKFI